MKTYIQIISLIMLVIFPCQGQNTSATLLSTEPFLANRFLAIDVLSNRYYEENGVLYKSNQNHIWQYKNLALGKIVKIDAENNLLFIKGAIPGARGTLVEIKS